jgi:hypothetical protein
MINKHSRSRGVKWQQDLSSVTIDFELKQTSIEKIGVTIGTVFARVVCTEKSYVKVVDLFDAVVCDSSLNKVEYSNDVGPV